MKIIELPQRSANWLNFRDGKISGSKAKEYAKASPVSKDDLLAFAESKGYEKIPKNTTIAKIREMLKPEELDEIDYHVELSDGIYKLIAENIANPINISNYNVDGERFSMALRGAIMETEAREKTAEKLGKKIIEGRVWQSSSNPNIICSPDGEIAGDNGKITEALEIKCLDSWKCVKAFYEKHPPVEYQPQIIQYFLANEDLKTLYFAIYSDVFPLNPEIGHQIYTIKREEIAEEVAKAEKIQNAILKLVEQEVKKLTF